jgi:carbon-monoxide dehydrogenase medium subunit
MKVHVPTSVDEVVGLLGDGVLVAGGTHAVPRLRPDESIVSLRRAGLSGVEEDGDELRVGATTTLTALARRVPFLRSAIESIGSPPIRNLATVGGNLFVPQPHGDLAVCLLALDARVERQGDLVTGVAFKVPERWFYTKAMRRKQNSASIVTVASDGVRIALGGVAREPVRAHAAEEALARGDVDAAAAAALEAADPFDDAYASAWYRRRVLPVHVRRALSSAV